MDFTGHAAEASLAVTVALLAVALLYLVGFVRLRRVDAAEASPAELSAFLVGVLALWAAVGSPLSRLDHHLLSMHMLQHLVVMTVAAPLLLLGAPGRVAAALLGREAQPLRRAATPFTHPVVCWLAGTGVVVLWHIPSVLEASLHSGGWHAVQQASFLLAGTLFWWPVVLPWPAVAHWGRWSMPLYLFLATLPCDALSAFLAFSGRVVYPAYGDRVGRAGLSPLSDQEWAGALMWFFVTLAYLLPAVLITLRLLAAPRKASASGPLGAR